MQDFPSALESAWNADPTLAAAGLTPLYYAVAPGSAAPYPYVVLNKLGGRVVYRNFTRMAVDEDHYRFNVYSSGLNGAATLGDLVTAFLDGLGDDPPAFDNGTLIDFHRSGDDLIKLPKSGVAGVPFVWLNSMTYVGKISRTRP